MTVESNEASSSSSREKEPVFTNPQKVYTEEPQLADQVVNEKTFNNRPNGNGQGKYPKIVGLIILNELCERFSYYGIRTVLFIFLTDFLSLPENTATAIYHAFTVVCYFTPVLGAIISDGYIGLYKTILYVSCLYCCGNIVLTLTSMAPLGAPNVAGPMIGLLIIAIGTGGIKPCVAAFGGNQFHSYQKGYLETFFSFFYLAINVGSTIGTILTPIFRNDVKCFGNDCYPLAFGVPAVFMFIAIGFFLIGTPFYRRDNDKVNGSGNIITQTMGCIFLATVNKLKSYWQRRPKRAHWIDYADHKYSAKLISDVKAFCKVILVFVPLPIFWAVFDQQGSRWTAQALQLNGRIGSFTIKPDQFQAVNPIMIIFLVPFFNFVVYPLMAKCGIFKRPLQRMGTGIVFAMLAFIIAAFLEWQMQKATAHRNPDQQIKLVNLLPCQLELVASDDNSTVILTIPPPSLYNNHAYRLPQALTKQLLSQPGSNSSETATLFKLNAQCWHAQTGENYSLNALDVRIPTGFALNTLIFYSSDLVNSPSSSSSGRVQTIGTYSLPFSISNRPIGRTEIRFLKFHIPTHLSPIVSNEVVTYSPTQLVQVGLMPDSPTLTNHLYSTVDYSNYRLTIKASNGNELLKGHQIQLLNCARYSIVLFTNSMTSSNTSSLDFVTLTDIHPNGISLGWQAIQISIMAVAEILFTVSSMVFVYSQAPASMKSLVHVCFACAVGLGQVLVVFVVKLRFFKDQVHEYLLFAFMLAASALAFILLSIRYEYIQSSNEEPTADEQRRRNSNAEINTTYPHRSSLRRMSVVSPRPSWIPIEKTEMTPITSLS